MQVEEAKKELAALSKRIRQDVQQFESRSGLTVDQIVLRRAPTIGAASVVYNVELTARAEADYGL